LGLFVAREAMTTEQSRSGRPLELQEFAMAPWLLRRVTCPNPFYLLSAACFIHATGIPLKAEGHPLPPEGLLGLIAGYAVVMAAITFVIVRFWKVWDDARSIFLILLLLFLELALCSDGTLQADPRRGTQLLAVGLFVAVAISEFLLRGLRLRLPASYRLPYYAQLVVLFLYPLCLLPSLQANDAVTTTWRIFALPFVIGLSILTLWPAVRRGPSAVENNGSPWKWGWYPWTLFVFLGFCLCLRSYTLCLSFDAATALKADAAYRLENIFGPYFLAPVVFAAAVLVMEAGLQSGRRNVQWVALGLPLIVIALCFPGSGRNAAEAQFIGRLLATVGAPAWWALIVAFAFWAVAAWRGVPGARRGAIYSLAALAVVDPGVTVSIQTLSPVQPWPLLAAALLTGGISVRTRRSSDWCEALALVAVAATRFGWTEELPVPAAIVIGNVVALVMVAIGMLLNDGAARILRHLGVGALMLCAAATCNHIRPVTLPAWYVAAYVGSVTTIVVAVAWLRPSGLLKAAALVQLAAAYGGLMAYGYQVAQRSLRWQGLPSLLFAVILLHLGMLTSALKAGLLQRGVQRMLRVDREPQGMSE
jgi:hypothetical protein